MNIADRSEIEIRSLAGECRSLLDEPTGIRTLIGYASVWDVLSRVPLRSPKGEPFWEKAARGAFLDDLGDPDIGCYFNHDTSKVLGRTGAGTLTVTEDDHGLLYQCVLPPTSYAADLGISIGRGDVWGCSIGMVVRRDQWGRDGQGRLIRTVLKARVFDVGPVSIPAFKETAVAFRSLDRWLAEGAADDAGRIAYLDRRIGLAERSR